MPFPHQISARKHRHVTLRIVDHRLQPTAMRSWIALNRLPGVARAGQLPRVVPHAAVVIVSAEYDEDLSGAVVGGRVRIAIADWLRAGDSHVRPALPVPCLKPAEWIAAHAQYELVNRIVCERVIDVA